MITSSANPRLKAIRKLRDRKERQASQLFYVEGLRPVIEAVQLKVDIETIIYSPDLLTSEIGRKAIVRAKALNYEMLETSAQVFKSLSLKEDPQGIAAVARQRWLELDEVEIKSGELWVALVEVADPGNLGTILRTLDAVGGKGVILLDHSTDPYDPSAIRASMGAVFSLKITKTSLDSFSSWKLSNAVKVVGAAGSAAEDYHRVVYPDKMVLMMGSERQGFLPQHLGLCDQVVRIPMVGRSDSLNLAVATAVVLYEIFNQQRSESETA